MVCCDFNGYYFIITLRNAARQCTVAACRCKPLAFTAKLGGWIVLEVGNLVQYTMQVR